MKHTISILIFTLLFSFSALSMEKDLTIGECNYSYQASKNLKVSVEENSKCLTGALEKKTEQNNKNKKTFSDASGKLKSSYDTIKPYMGGLLTLLLLYKLIQFLSPENRERAKQGGTDVLFKVSLFSLAVMIMSEVELIQDISDKGLNTIFHNMILPLAVNNHIKEQSDTVKQHAVEANRTIITEKIVQMSQSMFESEICAISYKANLMTSYSLKDLEVIDANPVLLCMDNYKAKNSSKSITEMDNRMLLSSAINHCSQVSESSHLIDCGKQYSLGFSQGINSTINKYSIEIARLANEFHAVNCNILKNKNKNNYETYCRDYTNGDFSLIETDKTLGDFDTHFNFTIESFVTDYSNIIKREMELIQKIVKEGKMASAYDQAVEAMTIPNRDEEYGKIIKDRVNELQFISPYRRDFETGRHLQSLVTDLKVIESVDDYFSYLNHSSLSSFENANNFASNLLRQFTWITDPEKLIGEYSDSLNEEFKINSDVLLAIQENKASFLAVGTITKISVAIAKRAFKKQGKPLGKLTMIDTIGSICIFLSFYKEVLTVTFISIGYALFLPTIITALILISLKFLSSLFLKVDIIYLGDEINDIYFNIQNISLSLLIPIVGTSLFANVIQHLIDNVDILNNGYQSILAILNLTVYLIVCLGLLAVQIYLMFWTYNYINSKSKSKSENIKDNPKTFALKGKKILRL
ncbi:hypothetical protein I6F48_00200 [Pseudoalteromonas sp. SWYJ118]|uniref:hypothetical protein n=1 Tax=Pseudoalteromonas sp. SWYJ118 TaxID=2792062 RepID=UPI0018CFC1D4|nr:hypothetical protein [Pseudoalteromonas sp. SWYJ118]MBH0073984.1 hypothetical protein [Pseudoalteromonas sp. SWYJ118]